MIGRSSPPKSAAGVPSIRNYDVEHLLHINISHAQGYTGIVTCTRGRARGEFDIRQSRLLMAYVPHFERAAEK